MGRSNRHTSFKLEEPVYTPNVTTLLPDRTVAVDDLCAGHEEVPAAGVALGRQQANAFLPGEKNRLIEAVRDGRTADTQASINTWLGAHQTIHSVAGTLGTNLMLQDTVQDVLREAQRQGLGEFDLSSLVKVFTHDNLNGGGV